MRGVSCRFLLQFACLAAALVGSTGTEQYAAHTLVLADDLSLATTHSQFLSQLEARGHKVTLSKADNASISLTHYGDYIYDNIVIFAPHVEEFGGALDVAEVDNTPPPLPRPPPQCVELPLTRRVLVSSSNASCDAWNRGILPQGLAQRDAFGSVTPLSPPASCSS